MTIIEERFWNKVDKSGECWVWIGAKTRGGYGNFGWPGRKSPMRANRVSWILAHGDIPDGLWVLHKCDNPPCVRPDHLFLGTRQENVNDMRMKKRDRRPVDKNGLYPASKLTWDDVQTIRREYVRGKNRFEIGNRKELCRRFGIGSTVLLGVIKNERWQIERAPHCGTHISADDKPVHDALRHDTEAEGEPA